MSKIHKLIGVEYLRRDLINVGNRLRKKTPEVVKHIEEIAESIRENGPITPLLIDEDNKLIAGGCRYEAYGLLLQEEVPVVRRNKISPARLRMLEVEENLRRLGMRWQEVCLGIYEVHLDKEESAARMKEKWGTRATGSLVKQSHSYVNDAIVVAQYLLRNDEDILKAPSMEAAKAILLRRKEEAAVQHRAATSASPIIITPKPQKKGSNPSGIISLTLGPPGTTPPPAEKPILASKTEVSRHQHVDLSRMLFNANCHEFLPTLPSGSIDIIVTDIPYGIDMNNLEDMHGVGDMVETHDVEENVEQMKPFLQESFRVLKPNSYLLFFYALQHHEKLRDWGEEVGFKVVDWPILWLKPHSCKNNAPHQNPTKSFEPVMVMKKGKPNLVKPMTKSHYECDGMTDKRLQSNPFAKPFEFLTWLFSHFVTPGMILLDPYAGEGSILRAAISVGCKPIGVELDTKRFPRLVARIRTIYKNNLGANTTFVEPK